MSVPASASNDEGEQTGAGLAPGGQPSALAQRVEPDAGAKEQARQQVSEVPSGGGPEAESRQERCPGRGHQDQQRPAAAALDRTRQPGDQQHTEERHRGDRAERRQQRVESHGADDRRRRGQPEERERAQAADRVRAQRRQQGRRDELHADRRAVVGGEEGSLHRVDGSVDLLGQRDPERGVEPQFVEQYRWSDRHGCSEEEQHTGASGHGRIARRQ